MNPDSTRHSAEDGTQPIKHIDDLLTPGQRAELHADLAEIARCRRRAEAEAAWLPMA